MKRHSIIALLGLLAAMPSWAQSYRVKDLEVDHPFATPTVQGAPTGAVYFTMANRGKSAERLLGASTPRAKRVELHSMSMSGDIMRMREVDSIEAIPGRPVKLEPGSANHLMLVGLATPLKAGERFPLTLRFEKAGALSVEVLVQKAAPVQDAAHRH